MKAIPHLNRRNDARFQDRGYVALLILPVLLMATGCASLEWPVDAANHRVGQSYGSYQGPNVPFHDGIDIISGEGLSMDKNIPVMVQGVVNGLRPRLALGGGPNPSTREVHISFQREPDDAFCAYGHVVELPFNDGRYVNVKRHRRYRSGGVIDTNHICIESSLGSGAPLDPATVAGLGGDDTILYAAGQPIAIQVGPNGWADTIPQGTDSYVGNYYYRDGGGASYAGVDYVNEPEREGTGPDPRTRLNVNKGQVFAKLSELWALPELNYRHLHFIVSSAEYFSNRGSALNPLHSGDAIGYTEGYDPQGKPPRVGPLFIQEADVEIPPDIRDPSYAQGQLDFSVEVTDRMGGEDNHHGVEGAYDEPATSAWPNTAGVTRNRWNGSIGVPMRVEYWVEGRGTGVITYKIGSSSSPRFVDFRGNPLSSADMNALWDPTHAYKQYVTDIFGVTSLAVERRYCMMLCNIVGSGYLRNSGVAGGAGGDPPEVAINDDGRWNTKAGNTDGGNIQWQTAGAVPAGAVPHIATEDAGYPLGVQSANHPGWQFPDGVYRLHVRAKDAGNNQAADQWDIRVDNWHPRIIKVKVEIKPGLVYWRTVYEYDWDEYARNHATAANAPAYPAADDLISTGLRGRLVGEGDQVRVRIQFSESMDTSSAWPGLDPPYVKVSYAGEGEHEITGSSSPWSSTVYANDTWTRTYTVPSDTAGISGAVGDMHLNVRKRDMAHKLLDSTGGNVGADADLNHLIDFKPRLERVSVYQGSNGGSEPDILVYRKAWKLKSDRTGLELDTSQSLSNCRETGVGPR